MKTRKRDGIFGVWFCTSIFAVCLALGVVIYIKDYFSVVGFAAYILYMTIIGLSSFSMIKTEEYVETLEYIIYEFEIWDKKNLKYNKRYIVDSKYLAAHYIFHWHVKDEVHQKSDADMEKHIQELLKEESVFRNGIGYETQAKAMNYIVELIRDAISREKSSENVRVRNVKTLEVFTYEEIKSKILAGEFDEKA